MILTSELRSNEAISSIKSCSMRYSIWSKDPPDVQLQRALAAWILISSSLLVASLISRPIITLSITAWIWNRFPAVIFETVQQASFLIDCFGEESKELRHGRTETLRITWV